LRVALPERFRSQIEAAGELGVETAWYSDLETALTAVPGCEAMWYHLQTEEVERVLAAGPELRWWSIVNAGVNGWPLEDLARRGLLLSNGAGLHAVPIAEYVLMGMLALAKRLPDLVHGQDRHEWIDTGASIELLGKRALIYGYGLIGREIAARLRGFGMEITGVRRRPGPERGVVAVEGWREHLPEADFVILSVPLTEATRALIGNGELSAMKPSAFLVNIARGALVDEGALTEALKSGVIAGAYLDVTETEPLPAGSELWSLPNLFLTPHSSSSSTEFERRAVELFRDNLERFRSGRPLRNLVDYEAGY
jgi:phosphoglycerate dehydrogenase-like enzyme